MKVFYVCRTGHHTSLLAASLHLGNVSDKVAEAKKIYSISGFDTNSSDEIGKPYLAGIDDNNAEIYTIGVTGENQLLIRAANDLIGIMGIKPGEWQIVDTSQISSKWTGWGRMLKRMHFNTLSKVFFYLGARQELPRLKKVVYRTCKKFGPY